MSERRQRKISTVQQPGLHRFPEDLIIRETIPGHDAAKELEEIAHCDLKLDVNFLNEYGHTALGTSAFVGSLRCCQILIHLGAEVSKKDNDGWTALHYALAKGYLDIAKLLIMNGGNLYTKNSDNETALDFIADSELKDSLLQFQNKCSMTHTEL